MLRTIMVILVLSGILASCIRPEKPLTKEEVRAFAKQIELSVEKREGRILDAAFDEKAFLKKMNLEPSQYNESIRRGIKTGLKWGTKLTEGISSKGSYSFIKQYEKNNVHHLLFRLYDHSSLNYHDFELKRTNGKPGIVDIYIYVTGEKISETLKGLVVDSKDEFSDRSAPDKDGDIDKLPHLRKLIEEGKNREALDIYDNLTEKMKKNRTFQLMHVQICAGLTEEEYANAIAEYKRLYPNEPNMQLLLIDGYVLRREYDKALEAVNELDKMIDKDPLLDFHRAVCYSLMEEKTKKREYLERLVKNLPDFEDGVFVLIADYLSANEFEKATPLVNRFKKKSAFDQQRLNELLDQYPGFK